MEAFDPALLTRPRWVVLNKKDLLPPDFPLDQVVAAYRQAGEEPLVISAHTGEGLPDLRRVLAEVAARHLEDAGAKEEEHDDPGPRP
jgi:50S ribosomal subunit-associated GTPase HflX